MCLQSACILSKSMGPASSSTCNTTQFGTPNLYNWYDYCLSSDNDNSGNYCATSTECYQYKKSIGPPSVTYAWHNLTCNPSTCRLIASNGAPPPIPIPPYLLPDPNNIRTKHTSSSHDTFFSTDNERHHHSPYQNTSSKNVWMNNPTAIALIIVSSFVTLLLLYWLFRCFQNRATAACPFFQSYFTKTRHRHHPPLHTTTTVSLPPSVISSIPSSAPPSFSSVPPDMAVLRHPHPRIPSSSTRSSLEPLPSYLSPYPPPPKYEQAIVTQIRDLREEDPITTSSSSSADTAADTAVAAAATMIRTHDPPPPSMWVPIYFTQPQAVINFRRAVNSGQVFGFTPSSHSYWLQQQQQFTPPPQEQPSSTQPTTISSPTTQQQQQLISQQENRTTPLILPHDNTTLPPR
ncbi:hypothetical protein BD770DRAFT_388902 [Pilaira anomala]|nr:hypothetical protein BD770DRAFT_388902 [Pilaira anomala]